MELCRIVDRLLKDRRYLPPRKVEQAVPHKVKLPPFWEKDAAAWFKLAEAVLEDNHVRDPWIMCRTVILHSPHPPPRAGEGQGGPEPAGGPLQGDEGQTCGATHPQRAELVHQHLVGSEVGSRRPTELTEVLLASLPMEHSLASFSKQFSYTASLRTSRTWWPFNSSSWRP